MVVDADLLAALRRMGLAGPDETPRFTALTGGVSSDIFRVDLEDGPICVKRALAKLRVAADWRAPVARNLYEARWMRVAAGIVPAAVPKLLGQDETAGALAMAYLAPEDHPVWKAELRDGRADPAFAAEVGRRLVAIHAATAADSALAAEFPTDAIFYDIRLEPYLVATAAAHPDCAPALHALVETTLTTKRALVHGDVSPKNILAGPQGPVVLDAECAWWGDPAFCLNHLLLKGLWRPDSAPDFLACFDTLAAAYLAGVDWEPAAAFESRAVRLLPGLFLARVDGKSPAEYLTDETQKDRVRRVARTLLLDPPARLAEIRTAWTKELSA
jgi:aminoglycoside phosphotransferase (APT) family kinase protein